MPVAPHRPKGPPLNALRAFEAAARLGGFARAGEELSVTPAAIAQHVKALEAWAGAPLFERRSQGVGLTPLGASVAEDFRRAFDALGLAQRALRARAALAAVNIAALPSVAQLWLSPRLPALRRAAPGVTISVTALEHPPNLAREMFDLSLFFRASPAGGRVLAEDRIFPVCAPGVAARLRAPADLMGETLLFDSEWDDDWPLWLAAAGIAGEAPRGPVFSLYSLALEEARNGAGVLIGHAPLVAHDLATGALVRPFGPEVAMPAPLCLEVAAGAARARAVGRILAALEGG